MGVSASDQGAVKASVAAMLNRQVTSHREAHVEADKLSFDFLDGTCSGLFGEYRRSLSAGPASSIASLSAAIAPYSRPNGPPTEPPHAAPRRTTLRIQGRAAHLPKIEDHNALATATKPNSNPKPTA